MLLYIIPGGKYAASLPNTLQRAVAPIEFEFHRFTSNFRATFNEIGLLKTHPCVPRKIKKRSDKIILNDQKVTEKQSVMHCFLQVAQATRQVQA